MAAADDVEGRIEDVLRCGHVVSSIEIVIPGWCVSTRPGISRFRVRCFASPRNDDPNETGEFKMTIETKIDTGTDELLCAIRDRVAIITLNRPQARNSLSDQLTPALRT